jgi:hypothetical protein
MWAGMLIFWGALIWAGWAVISSARKPHEGVDGDARRILDQRLARGEIGPGEYQRLTELIGSGDRKAPADTGSPR